MNNKGWTLIELIVVMMIIAILAGGITPTFIRKVHIAMMEEGIKTLDHMEKAVLHIEETQGALPLDWTNDKFLSYCNMTKRYYRSPEGAMGQYFNYEFRIQGDTMVVLSARPNDELRKKISTIRSGEHALTISIGNKEGEYRRDACNDYDGLLDTWVFPSGYHVIP